MMSNDGEEKDQNEYDNQPTTETIHLEGEKPTVGMFFLTPDEAYNFYNAYARCTGFTIRINNTAFSRKDKKILKRELCCSKEGFRRTHSRGVSPKKPRPITRVGCLSQFVIQFQDDGRYKLVEFVEEHNHDLAKPTEVHKSKSKGGVIKSMHAAGRGRSKIHSFKRKEVGGHEKLNFTKMDCNNFVQRERNVILKKGDARTLLDSFNEMQSKDPQFQYAVKLDDDDQLACLFWCDAKSRIDYDFFHDLMCFDTTYKTNGYDLPYAPFVGINQHAQSVLFGCALLVDETTPTLVWLFETFLKTMNGKQPKTIFTDQDPAIANAIGCVFSNSHHRLCLWHINQNAGKQLNHVYEKYSCFQENFNNCVYNNETVEEFETCWSSLIGKYGLGDNTWLKRLYNLREKWALVYGRDHFCADITTTQRSESMNSYFKKYFKRTMLLVELAAKYEEAVLDRREAEISEDHDSRQTMPILRSRWKVEQEAASVYTRTMFKRFQAQLLECLNLFEEKIGEDGTVVTYKISSYGNFGIRTVTFDSLDNSVKCSCKMFEFTGVLCSHALKVLHQRQLCSIPKQYYLHRWTKDATSGFIVDESEKASNVVSKSYTSRHHELSQIALAFAVKAATTKKSSELGKQELMQAMRKLDELAQNEPCQSGDGNTSISSVTNKNQGTGARWAEQNASVKDPPCEKDNDTTYGRRREALEKYRNKKAAQQKSNNTTLGKRKKGSDNVIDAEDEIRMERTPCTQVTQEGVPPSHCSEGTYNPLDGTSHVEGPGTSMPQTVLQPEESVQPMPKAMLPTVTDAQYGQGFLNLLLEDEGR